MKFLKIIVIIFLNHSSIVNGSVDEYEAYQSESKPDVSTLVSSCSKTSYEEYANVLTETLTPVVITGFKTYLWLLSDTLAHEFAHAITANFLEGRPINILIGASSRSQTLSELRQTLPRIGGVMFAGWNPTCGAALQTMGILSLPGNPFLISIAGPFVSLINTFLYYNLFMTGSNNSIEKQSFNSWLGTIGDVIVLRNTIEGALNFFPFYETADGKVIFDHLGLLPTEERQKMLSTVFFFGSTAFSIWLVM